MKYQHRHRLIIAGLIAAIVADVLAWRLGLDVKLCWAILSTAITIAGYSLYLSQMYPPPGKPTVKPEPLTWALFGFLTATGWLVQFSQGASVGSICLGLTAAACFVIAIWSYRKFEWKFDRLHFTIAALAFLLFSISFFKRNDPAWATTCAVAATIADLISYGPAFRKAWRYPHEESITNLVFNSVKCVPALLALQSYSVATTVYLLMLTAVNAGFAIFLAIRREILK